MTDGGAGQAGDAKMCPLISPRLGWEPWRRQNCPEDECAWWVVPGELDRESGRSGRCAIKDIANGIRAIEEVVLANKPIG